jgi:ribonuclease HI
VRAELIAINLALRLFPYMDLVILTDSSSSLDLIVNFFERKTTYHSHSHMNILTDIHDRIIYREASFLRTRFFKVKAHSGDHGNTIADSLARKARIDFENLYM